MSNFKDLGVKSGFIEGLTELGIHEPTEIQEQAIPYLIKVKEDFIGLAQTGTGKTAAFGLPLLQQINPKEKSVQGLILAPTRELVQQIKKQLFKFTKYSDKIFLEAVYGGALIKGIYVIDGGGYPRGAFWIVSQQDGLIIDGLRFEWENDYDNTQNGSWGPVTFNMVNQNNTII